jgi:pimeloyl-ACP methyl ester carboxylesterase
MGGYLAQYLLSTQPDQLISVTLANTFVPTMPVLRAASMLRLAIRLFPLTLIHSIFRWVSLQRLVPAGGHDPLLEAYLIEVSYAGLRKRDFLARLSSVTESFIPVQIKDQSIPLLIIESENDPLIRPEIREALCEMYPYAQRYTFQRAGHFPYLNQSEAYTATLRTFLGA